MIRIILRDVCHVNKHLSYRSQSQWILVAFYIHLKHTHTRTRTHTHAFNTLLVFFLLFKTFWLLKQMRSKNILIKKWYLYVANCLTHSHLTALCSIAHSMWSREAWCVRTHVAWLCKSKWTWRRFCTFCIYSYLERYLKYGISCPLLPLLIPH